MAHTAASSPAILVVDDFSREWLALVVDRSLSGSHVVRDLDRYVEFRGAPLMVVGDQGTQRSALASIGRPRS